jgi:HEAT repeat protein
MLEYGHLLEALTCVDSQRAALARASLLATGRSAVPWLLNAVTNATTDRERWRMLSLLAEIGDPRVVPVMINQLHAQSSAIRALAAQYLGTCGDSTAVEPMLHVLSESEPDYSPIWVIDALGKLGDKRAVEPLLAFLRRTESATERYMAIEALGRLGDPRAIDQIRLYANDPDHHVRDRVERALQRLTHAG